MSAYQIAVNEFRKNYPSLSKGLHDREIVLLLAETTVYLKSLIGKSI